HWAAQKGNIEIMEVLLDFGLSVDVLRSDGGDAPLDVAAGHGHYRACEWLLDHGADINRGLGNAATPIFSAVYSRSLELVALFIDRGANLEATFGEPKIDIIEYATKYGSPNIIKLLETSK